MPKFASSVSPRHVLTIFALMATGMPAVANAQSGAGSNAGSDASAASLEASLEVPVALYEAIAAGGLFSVTAVESTARGSIVTVMAAGMVVSLPVMAVIEPDYNLISGTPKTPTGTAIMTSAGLLLMLGSKALAFIPEPKIRPHIHSRRLAP